ncbi:excinuclease ABC subunit UvrB [Candidatus Uhrbacteria bacterium]|nr:excinuclease ABC subunit UvrB [Candidatus Uhrbacteria bacterium]
MPLTLAANFEPTGDQPRAIKQLTDWVGAGYPHATLLGVTGSGKTFTMAGVIATTQKPTLVISPNKTLAAQLYSEFKAFFPTAAVHYFVSYYDYYQPEAYVPQTDTYIEKEAMINEEIDRLRHASTQSILSRRDVIIVASVSCIYGLGSPEEYGAVRITLRRGDPMDRATLLRKLVDLQFQRNDVDLARGTFRVKGDTVEIFPKASDKEWIRVECFGNVIDRITARDISGTTGALEEIAIFPATHYVAPAAQTKATIGTIRAELETRLTELRAAGKILEAARLEQRTTYDLQMLEETGYVHGIENYSRYFDGRQPGEPPFTLVDFFQYAYGGEHAGWLCFIDESHITIPQIRGMYAGDQSRKQTLIAFGFRLPSCKDNRPLQFREFTARTPQTIYVSATPEEYEMTMSVKQDAASLRSSSSRGAAATRDLTPDTDAAGTIDKNDRGAESLIAEQLIRPTGLLDPVVEVRPSEGQIQNLISEITTRVGKGERTLVTVLTKRMAEDLAEFLRDRDVNAFYIHADVETFDRIEILDDLRRGTYDVVVGINLLREGLDLPEVSLVAILDADKEGYLRSATALIQTIGRAARHIHGTAILYADRTTEAMRIAMSETHRRRVAQEEYNRTHGITPKTIAKEIRGPLVTRASRTTDKKRTPRRQRK